MENFLTVKQAAGLTGKSTSSIRRIIYPIVEAKDHPDRGHILPSDEDALALRIKGENFAWKLSEDLLRRKIPAPSESEKGSAATSEPQPSDANADLVDMLRRELDIKNHQIQTQADTITKQMELISGLTERIGESNVLVASLHQQLSPPAPTQRPAEHIVDAEQTEAKPREKGSKKSVKQAKPTKGFFTRLFR